MLWNFFERKCSDWCFGLWDWRLRVSCLFCPASHGVTPHRLGFALSNPPHPFFLFFFIFWGFAPTPFSFLQNLLKDHHFEFMESRHTDWVLLCLILFILLISSYCITNLADFSHLLKPLISFKWCFLTGPTQTWQSTEKLFEGWVSWCPSSSLTYTCPRLTCLYFVIVFGSHPVYPAFCWVFTFSIAPPASPWKS